MEIVSYPILKIVMVYPLITMAIIIFSPLPILIAMVSSLIIIILSTASYSSITECPPPPPPPPLTIISTPYPLILLYPTLSLSLSLEF